MNISAITFDAGNTLIRLVRPPGKIYADVARRFGPVLDAVKLQAGFRYAWKVVPRLPDSPGPRTDDGVGWWRDVVRTTLSYAGADLPDFEAYFHTLYREFALPGVWELVPEAEDLLTTLRNRRLRLGIISNFDGRLRVILGHLGVLEKFEHLVISSELGLEKPSRHLFAEAARRFQLSPPQILHVGDDQELDEEAAIAAGFQALLVRTPADLLSVLDLLR